MKMENSLMEEVPFVQEPIDWVTEIEQQQQAVEQVAASEFFF